MNDTKKIGRPRKFDADEAMMAAVSTFWTKGYDGASMKDLTDAMGISGPSLYAAFGDKRQLYLKAIDAYASNDACAPLVAFEAEPDIGKAVRAFMIAAIDYATAHESGAKGCFLSSCVATTAGEVEGVDQLLADAIKDTDERLAARFAQEVELGNLASDFPVLARARLLFDLRQGFVFRARAGLDAATMKAELNQRCRMILE
ncbi:TetR/AcrR family transcriptional regulator [Erythrobacter sp. F6033]|uniref:TetR/AcrR family transcriptional regulator n=1 Tax=Erythrobacter sp. F6033 TaxID=2926401 RepID=UPI001FF34CD2|nr:TetR/AcrR family transcriptional regulator [Erythrobacter sp. F6033]MCK0128858.1 TetR/AcrR family transcriptional regulator [Erythrobacter sp. F6033]